MRKKIAAALAGGLMLAGLAVTPAGAQQAHCVPFLPDSLGCWIQCNVNYIFAGMPPPGNPCTTG